MPGARPRFVFACFKRIERCGDWMTGAAGPLFVASASVLFILGTLCFRMSLSYFNFFFPT
jgi:palmitoyltransferase